MKPKFRTHKCKYFEGNYCIKIKHYITNGYAEITHCSKCKFFEKGRTEKEYNAMITADYEKRRKTLGGRSGK